MKVRNGKKIYQLIARKSCNYLFESDFFWCDNQTWEALNVLDATNQVPLTFCQYLKSLQEAAGG
ncbi:MAG: hypothetical protein KZQ77_05000 [Candidatus Thiodiazotropha sp. (ex Notomyrtea botanica)]|nr:hypothetical protein [Candidatus Thiodiazotropha sp. (ex Notomyrtea botanica)]